MNKAIDREQRAAAGAKVKRAVKLLTVAHGITMGEAATRAGVAPANMYNKFKGEGPLELSDLEAFADVFGLSASQLLDIADGRDVSTLVTQSITCNSASPGQGVLDLSFEESLERADLAA